MAAALRRFFDVRPGETRLVVLTLLYVALAVASFLLAKPIRNGLFLSQYGAYKLVYVYVAVPLVLSLAIPLYTRVAARVGTRLVLTGSLVFFSLNVLAFWYLFTFAEVPGLAAIFYVWVNCFGIIAPVQAWTFANTRIRCAPGAAAVRADRQRRQSSVRSWAGSSRASWRAGWARSTCCWCSPCSSCWRPVS